MAVTKLTEQEKELLKSKSAYALPDNPSNKGFSAEQIKKKQYEPNLILFDWLSRLIDETDSEISDIKDGTTVIPYATKASQDEDGNNIKSNYANYLNHSLSGNNEQWTFKVGLYSKSGEKLDEETQVFGKATNITAGLMSASDKAKLDAMSGDQQEEITNKVTSISSSSTDVQYPSAKCVYDVTENIREVAEGKCKSYTISLEDNADFDSEDASLTGISEIITTEGTTVSTSDLKNGDVILIIETPVPDRWYSEEDEAFYKMETAKVDLNDYYTKSEVKQNIVKEQATATVVINALTNINGKVLTTFKATFQSTPDCYSICKYDEDNDLDIPLTEEEAMDYMNRMSGTKYLPPYNYDYPRNSIWIMADGTFWKPQYQSNGEDTYHGLYLFKIPSPFALTANVVDLANNQTITGVKTLPQTTQLRFEATSTPSQYKMAISSDTNYHLVLGRYTSSGALLQGGITVGKDDLSPTANNQLDLGSSSYKWKDSYVAGSVYLGSDWSLSEVMAGSNHVFYIQQISQNTGLKFERDKLYPHTNNYTSLGSSSNAWKNLCLTGAVDFGDNAKIQKDSSNRVNILYSNNVKVKVGSGDTIFCNNVTPDSNNTYNLGGSSLKWNNLYLTGSISDGTNSASVTDVISAANSGGGTTVEAASFDISNTALNGITIGSTTYRLIDQGYINHRSSVAIGNGSSASGTNRVVIGASAASYGSGAVSLGSGTVANGDYSIAIGYQARNYVHKTVCFGPDSETIHMKEPQNIFFRNTYSNQPTKSTLASYTSGHYLSEYIQNNELVFNTSKYYVSYTDANNYKTFSKVVASGTATDISTTVKGVHLIVRLSDNTSVSLDLLPYDTANSQTITAKQYIELVDNQYVEAYIDSDGCVNITINSQTLLTVTSAYYNLK